MVLTPTGAGPIQFRQQETFMPFCQAFTLRLVITRVKKLKRLWENLQFPNDPILKMTA